jgi:acyl-homoserine-lactone acylase
LGVPWVDTLATDKSGIVYYGDVTPVPNVPSDKVTACVPALNLIFQLLAQNGLYVLSGDNSDCNWNQDPTAPQKGIMPASQLPSMLRTDYVQNSNESAWMTNPSQPVVGFPPIVSTDSTEQRGRTRYALSQIAARLDGSDGLPGNRFNMSSLQSLVLSNRSFYAGALLADLISACDLGAYVMLADGTMADISKGCTVIREWDGKAELTSVGYPLFDAWNTAMLTSGANYWDVPFDSNDPVNTPRGMRVTDPLAVLTARQMLAQAMKTLDDQGLDYTKPLGQIQVAIRGNKRIPIHGGSSLDVYNTTMSSAIGDGQFDVWIGSSALFTVSFEGDSPNAQGFLTYSQSTNPASPYYSDQTERFSAKEWIQYPFTDAEIAADPKLSVKELSQ